MLTTIQTSISQTWPQPMIKSTFCIATSTNAHKYITKIEIIKWNYLYSNIFYPIIFSLKFVDANLLRWFHNLMGGGSWFITSKCSFLISFQERSFDVIQRQNSVIKFHKVGKTFMKEAKELKTSGEIPLRFILSLHLQLLDNFCLFDSLFSSISCCLHGKNSRKQAGPKSNRRVGPAQPWLWSAQAL